MLSNLSSSCVEACGGVSQGRFSFILINNGDPFHGSLKPVLDTSGHNYNYGTDPPDSRSRQNVNLVGQTPLTISPSDYGPIASSSREKRAWISDQLFTHMRKLLIRTGSINILNGAKRC